jgi:ATP dependent DNA ligase-like protein
MTALLDKSRVEIKLADYGIAPATALADTLLLTKVQDYRRAAAMRLYPLEGADISQKIPAAEMHVSRKIDGEFTVLVYRQGEAFTLNPGGTVRVGLPLLDEAARLLSKAGVKEALIAGELYVARDDRRPRVADVVSAAGRPADEAELGQLRFAAFDLVSLNGAPPPTGFRETWQKLTKTFGGGTCAHPVEAQWVSKPDQVRELYERWVEKEGAEGLVARSDAAGSFKIKPRHNLDVAVIGFSESTGDRAGLLHDMLVAVMRREGTLHVLGRVGGGFTDEQRKEMLSDLKDMAADSEYAEVSSDHVAYQMVRPDWVVEISCLDLVSQNTRGGPVSRMVLDWHANNGHSLYRTLRRMPLASVISPQFVRRRDDKQVRPTDVRITQVADLVEVPQAERDARKLVLPKSEVLRREVYVKELKGETMVRKLALWKTNKEQVSEDYPAYAVHLTDFSPNRKDPLSRDMRISSSFEQIQELFNQLKGENITKGWNLHAQSQAAAQAPALTAPAVVLAPAAAAPAPPTSTAEAAPTEAIPTAKKKAPRKLAASDAEAPPPAKAPRKKKSG